MAKYNFYFESGSQAYIMHLSDSSDSESIQILRENTKTSNELLRLQKEVTIISYNNSREDISVRMTHIELNNHEAIVSYEDNSTTGKIQENTTSQVLSIGEQPDLNYVSILNLNEKDPALEKYSVIVRYRDFSGKVEIVCSPVKQIYDVVLDFGSEASQMLIQRRDSGVRCEPIELFKGCAKHFYGIDNIDKAVKEHIYEYDQQDEDIKLFRSVFFLDENKKDSTSSCFNSIISRPSQDDMISFISRRDKNDKGERVPNVKISYLTGINPAGLKMEDLHRGIVMRFIHEALCTIADKEITAKEEEFSFSLRVTLLVPNVMCQNDVSAFVQFIQKSVQDPDFLKQVPQALKLAIVEIRTCSESDASLLNWINKHSKKSGISPGRYLIIDIGKGTTDFSVVKVVNARQAESIFRSGFVGAGNALSYAILDNYLTHLVDPHRDARKRFILKLLSAEPARLYQLEQAIEAVKRREPSGEKSKRLSDPDKLDVETLIEKITKTNAPDDYNIISDIIYKIVVKEIIGRIKNIKFDHVVLSGRAFKYKPLYDEICKDFKVIFPNVKIHYDKSEAKIGCLYGPLTPIEVSKFSNIVGEPKSVDISNCPKAPDDIDKLVETLKNPEVRDNQDRRRNTLNDIVNLACQGWRYIFPVDEDEDGNNSGESMADSLIQSTKKPGSTVKKDKKPESQKGKYSVTDIMSKGIHIPNYGENTGIYISGDSYIPQNANQIDPNAQYTIYFDGEDFYLRSAKSCIPLRKDTTLTRSSPLLFESLFPYSIQLLGEQIEIPIPKAKCE